MFTLKNTETNTLTTFTPWGHGSLDRVHVDQIHDGHLGIQADMLVEEAREFWRTEIKNGAVQCK